jgi:hypothetical protein
VNRTPIGLVIYSFVFFFFFLGFGLELPKDFRKRLPFALLRSPLPMFPSTDSFGWFWGGIID